MTDDELFFSLPWSLQSLLNPWRVDPLQFQGVRLMVAEEIPCASSPLGRQLGGNTGNHSSNCISSFHCRCRRARHRGRSIRKPTALRDLAVHGQNGWVGGARADVSTVEYPLAPRSGTSQSIVRACRNALMQRAQPYDLASMEVVGNGKPRRLRGRAIAPLDVRAIYRIRGVHEVIRSTVRCEIDRAGRVIATT